MTEEEFEKTMLHGDRKIPFFTLLKRTLAYAKGDRWRLILAMFLVILNVVIDLMLPIVQKWFVDYLDAEHIENAVLVDILPAGLELEDDTFKTRSQKVPGAEKAPDGFVRLSGRSELRDDRYLWFGSVDGLKDDRRHLLEYRVRAVTPGTYHVPSATVEDMYNPDLRGGIEGNGVFTVE